MIDSPDIIRLIKIKKTIALINKKLKQFLTILQIDWNIQSLMYSIKNQFSH